MASSAGVMQTRCVRGKDAGRLAELCTQLGYPAAAREVAPRLKLVMRDKEAACFVAESEDGVMGWIHVSVTPMLEVEKCAEIKGLVVDEKARSQGAGALLLRAAEKWARGKKCKKLLVRSNVFRKRAHEFYERSGFEHYKTQKAFQKAL